MRKWARVIYVLILSLLLRYLKWEYRHLQMQQTVNLRQRDWLLARLADATATQTSFKFKGSF